MQNLGWIKLHRKLREWEWYSDTNCVRVFLELLLTCEYTDKKWRGIIVKRGQLLTSLKELSSITNLTEKQIRTVLDKLKKTGEIRSTRADQGQLVTLTHYEEYQDERLERAGERADRGQTEGRPRAGHIDKELKETKNIRSKEEDLSLPSYCETQKESVIQLELTPIMATKRINEEFEELWRAFPAIITSRGSKQEAKERFKVIRKTISFETILQGVTNYATYLRSSGHPSQQVFRWLAKGRWAEDYAIIASPSSNSRPQYPVKKTQNQLAREAVFGVEG